MGDFEAEDLARELLGSRCDDGRRFEVIRRLAEDDAPQATAVLIRLAQAENLDSVVSTAAGRALAQICFRRGQDLDDLVLAEMTGDAYLAYDEEIARLQRLKPDVRMRRGIVGSGR